MLALSEASLRLGSPSSNRVGPACVGVSASYDSGVEALPDVNRGLVNALQRILRSVGVDPCPRDLPRGHCSGYDCDQEPTASATPEAVIITRSDLYRRLCGRSTAGVNSWNSTSGESGPL